MPDQKAAQPTPGSTNVDQRQDMISDAEAEAEIDFPTPTPTPRADTTPAVRIAIDKAADMLRQLRGD